MACLDRETATGYLRGDLEPREAARWAAHLATCDACRRVVEDVSALIDGVRQDLMVLDVSSHAAWPSLERRLAWRRSAPPVIPLGGWLRPTLRPTAITAAIASLAVLAVVLWMRGTPVSAAEMLERASTAERATDQKSGDVLFRAVIVEERHGPARTLISRRRVETWRKTGTAVTARRTYNESGRLVAAEWIDHAGGRTLYANGQAPSRSNEAPLPPHALLRAERIWRLDLSATAFSSLIGAVAEGQASETPNAVHLRYEPSSGDLTAATLTLSKTDLRAVEETLQLGRGDETHEFRIAEDRVSRVAPESVAAAVFAVDTNLEGTLPSAAAHAITTPKRLSESALMSLEVEALHLLDGAGALLGEQVSVTRTPAGVVRVEATVDSAARKEAIERALAPLTRSTSVRVAVDTFEAAARRDRSPSGHTPVFRSVEVQKDDMAVGPVLRRYFSPPDAEPDVAAAERVRAFASQAVEWSRLIVQHAWAMKNLAGRYRPDARRALDERARGVWLTLIRQHAATVAEHSFQLRQLLHPVFFPEEPLATVEPGAVDEDVLVAAERVLALAHTQDEAVRAAFVASVTSPATAPVSATFLQTPSFWHALGELAALAQRTASE